MTKELLELFKQQGYTGDKSAKDIKIVCKFYHPLKSCKWYCYEYDEQDEIFYGYVDLYGPDSGCCESGTISLAELESINSIIQDKRFKPFSCTLLQLRNGERP